MEIRNYTISDIERMSAAGVLQPETYQRRGGGAGMSIDAIMADLAQYIRRMWYNRYVKGVPDCYLSCC